MMKLFFCLNIFCLSFATLSFAQTDSTISKPSKNQFRKRYLRLGINMVGNNLNTSVLPKENIMNGNLGTEVGFVIEAGHIFYFLKKTPARKINVGLDWTIISLSYNDAKRKWKDYSTTTGHPEAVIEGLIPSGRGDDKETAPMVASVATKLGPVVAINPIGKLVIELRAQLSAGLYSYLMGYTDDNYFFATVDNSQDDTKFSDILLPCIKPNAGITIRHGRFGLAFDYSPGRANIPYSVEQNGNENNGMMKVPFNSFQLKVNL